MSTATENDRKLTTAEAAAYLGFKPQTLINDRCNATLGVPYLRLSARKVLYRQSDLDAWIEDRVVRPGAAD